MIRQDDLYHNNSHNLCPANSFAGAGRPEVDGSNRVVILGSPAMAWLKGVSCQSFFAYNRKSMGTYFPVCLIAPCEAQRITRNQGCVCLIYAIDDDNGYKLGPTLRTIAACIMCKADQLFAFFIALYSLWT